MPNEVSSNADALVSRIRTAGRCLVAFSGGVDSSVVAKAALQAVGKEQCLAITAVSPSLAEREKLLAQSIAREIGINHRLVETEEIANPQYLANDGRRCFYCKSELYQKMTSIAKAEDFPAILNGTNADDHSDYRPGLEAANDHEILSPLADCRIGKSAVREIANHWNLTVWDKPASPCLASRIAYHEPVDPAKLKMVELAEDWLLERGFREVRVRFHAGDMARIEVPLSELDGLVEPRFREALILRLKELGFRFVTLDLEGFRSGNLNSVIQTYEIQDAKRG